MYVRLSLKQHPFNLVGSVQTDAFCLIDDLGGIWPICTYGLVYIVLNV